MAAGESYEVTDTDEGAALLGGRSGGAAAARPRRLRMRLLLVIVLLACATITLTVLYVLERRDADDKQQALAAEVLASTEVRTMCAEAAQVPGGEARPPPGFHAELRAKVAEQLQPAVAAAGGAIVVLMQSWAMQTHFYADTELRFWADSNLFYMSGYERGDRANLLCSVEQQQHNTSATAAGMVPAAEPALNMSCALYVPEPTLTSIKWNGFPETLAQLRLRYQVDTVQWLAQLPQDAASLVGNITARIGRPPQLHTLPDPPASSLEGPVSIPAELGGLPRNTSVLLTAIAEARAVKTPAEIRLLQLATTVGGVAHKRVMRDAQHKSAYEYEVEAQFVLANSLCGLDRQAYTPIVGSGPRSAILHYNVNQQRIDNNWVLIDAGAQYYHYSTDITRTWPVNGQMSIFQESIYNIVLAVQNTGIAHMVAGMPWTNVTAAARDQMLELLLQYELINGSMPELLSADIASVFQPHSLGHHVGLDVHDPVPGGLGRCRPSEDPSQPLVCPGVLEAGMVLTCEPGIYLNSAYLEEVAKTDKARFLNMPLIHKYMAEGLGGVRIEDMVVVQPDGKPPLVLSENIPRFPQTIAAWISGGKDE